MSKFMPNEAAGGECGLYLDVQVVGEPVEIIQMVVDNTPFGQALSADGEELFISSGTVSEIHVTAVTCLMACAKCSREPVDLSYVGLDGHIGVEDEPELARRFAEQVMTINKVREEATVCRMAKSFRIIRPSK